MKKFLFLLILPLWGDAISDIAGPVIIPNTSPWAYYDKAQRGNITDVVTAMLANKPTLGAAAAGTFNLADGCTITLTGTGASEFTAGDILIVGWNNADGTGQGRLLFNVAGVVGNVISSSTQCQLPPGMVAQTGLTIYHCDTNCKGDTGSPVSFSQPWWAQFPGSGWKFYDIGFSLYRYYLRTGDSAVLTQFRDFTDTCFAWCINSGAMASSYSIDLNFASQFIRALDGQPQRFAALYIYLKGMYATNQVNITPISAPIAYDNRFTGYFSLYVAMGARADPDATRHTWYCTQLATDVQKYHDEMTSLDASNGYWMEKSYNYPYRLPSVSPWRMFAPTQALARGYDILSDVSVAGCNNTAKAAVALSTLTKAANFIYNYGYGASRGIYYDVMGPNNGQVFTSGTGTVSVTIGSKSLVGVGTHFLTDFAGGTKFIGIQHSDGAAWAHSVPIITDDTHATLGENWGDPGGGAVGTNTNAVAETFLITNAEPTNCASSAPTCFSLIGSNDAMGKLNGDRDSNMDVVWTEGWMYKTTRNPIWKTRGDEIFSATYGGPVGGPGFNYPGSSGPCGGPGCDGNEPGYILGIHACAVDTTLPCVSFNDSFHTYYGNAYAFQGKRFNQGSGIGGADNYLAWRLLTANYTVKNSKFGKVRSKGSVH